MLLGLGSLLALVIGSGRMAAFKSSLEPWRAPLAVILGVAFVVYAYRSITGQRDETRLREVEKARDSIRAEVRRMVTEFERAWTSTLTDSLREQLAVAQRQADDALRAAQGRQASELADEKKRLQRQLQSLDATERQATTVAKSREVHAERIAALQGELRQ